MKLKRSILIILLFALCAASGCTDIPEGVQAVSGFKPERYTGKWYEIARLYFKYEKNMNNTSAHYSINDDGSISVVNRGYNYIKKEWNEARGTAHLMSPDGIGRLKVSFFGPFYGGYNIIALDPEYRYSLVTGNSKKQLWLLSRSKSIPADVKRKFLKTASDYGYRIDQLIWVEHQ